jgi:hypothetical protein
MVFCKDQDGDSESLHFRQRRFRQLSSSVDARVQMLRQMVLPGMEQADMGRVLLVPIGSFVLVAAGTAIDEVL